MGSFFLLINVHFYPEICLEKVEGKAMNTKQRQSHKSFRISESRGRPLTKHLKRKTSLPRAKKEVISMGLEYCSMDKSG